MQNGLHRVVEFDYNDKWFVLAEQIIQRTKYSFLVKVNETEDDFLEEYQVVKSYFENGNEYMDTVKGDELKKVVPLLIPDSKKYIDHPEMLKEFLGDIDAK